MTEVSAQAPAPPRTTPLYEAHREAGGRFVTFAGWRLPVHYGSILGEARAVRASAGMFDVSHMGRFRLRGAGALGLLQRLGTNDLAKIGPGRAQYTLWCGESGGTIDDLIVWWLGDDDFVAVVNASRRDDDMRHLLAHAGAGVEIADESDDTAMVAVQGPGAVARVAGLGAGDAASLRRFGVGRFDVAGVPCTVARTGYTGEDGVEIACDAASASGVWEALRSAGVQPCGLGARDALRMEMGFPLYGHELSDDVSPLEARVGFAVSLDKDGFVGRDALRVQAAEGTSRMLAGFVCERPCVPAQGDVLSGVEGSVTSGGTSVVLERPIGLAFVAAGTKLPAQATLHNRGREIAVEVRGLPLIERARPKAGAGAA